MQILLHTLHDAQIHFHIADALFKQALLLHKLTDLFKHDHAKFQDQSVTLRNRNKKIRRNKLVIFIKQTDKRLC